MSKTTKELLIEKALEKMKKENIDLYIWVLEGELSDDDICKWLEEHDNTQYGVVDVGKFLLNTEGIKKSEKVTIERHKEKIDLDQWFSDFSGMEN